MTELADTTAWSWSRRRAYPSLRQAFDAALIEGELATCDMVRLELLHSARDAVEFAQIRSELEALPDCPIGEEQWDRAFWVYGDSALAAAHSSAPSSIPISSSRPLRRAPARHFLHYDEDYDRIVAITGQPTRWLAPKGSLR